MTRWTCKTENLSTRIARYTPLENNVPITIRRALELLESDEPFRSFFIKLLSDSPFVGYRWETSAITAATAGRMFEFVLLDTPEIDRLPDTFSFAEHFRKPTSPHAAVFENIGKDATLIAPTPLDPHAGYVHIAAFIRTAPRQQVHAFFQLVGKTTLAKISAKPLWLSTAGMGVAWLHVRIDDKPKYYGFAEYRNQSDR
jgi:hypothetical protein